MVGLLHLRQYFARHDTRPLHSGLVAYVAAKLLLGWLS